MVSGRVTTMVTREIRYTPHQISLADACGLVWNCTDVLPGHAYDALTRRCELAIQRQTYAAAARGLLAALKAEDVA